MTNRLDRSVQLAVEAQEKLRDVHKDVGDFLKQNGAVIDAYRRARRTLETDPLNQEVAQRAFRELREDIGAYAVGALLDAEQIGIEQARLTFDLYGLEFIEPEPDSKLLDESTDGVDYLIRRQLATYIALLLSGEVSKQLFIGDGPVWGILNPRPVITTIKNFVANILNAVLSRVVTGQPGMGYLAVAILDKKTSPCCRAVDGQVQPIGRPFHLTEPPNYAEYMLKPPFHDGCRTTRALIYLSEAQ